MSLLTEAATGTAATVSVGETADAAIDCRQCSVRSSPDRRVVTAFDNVSFYGRTRRIPQRARTLGCGKSTLLRVVADLIDPSKAPSKLFA